MTKREFIAARGTTSEKTALKAIARREKTNLSGALRLAIREAAQRRGIVPDCRMEGVQTNVV